MVEHHLEETMQVLVILGMKIINIFWPKETLHFMGSRYSATASWKSPIGDAPALTEEQTAQNTARYS
jgi:hypothetical protein